MVRPGPLSAAISIVCACLLFPISVICSGDRQYLADAGYARIRDEMQRGDYLQAGLEAQRCYGTWRTRPDEKWHWKFRLLDAELLMDNGDTGQAAALLTAKLPERYADLQPRLQRLQGYIAFRKKDAEAARAILARAAADAHLLSQFDVEADSDLLLTSHPDLAHPEQTEKLTAEILQLGALHKLPEQMAAAQVNLGMLRIRQSRYAAAVPEFEEAEKIAVREQTPLFRSLSLTNLAECYDQLGDFDKGLELRKQAIELEKKEGLNTLLRDSYWGLGESQLLQGEVAAAIESLRRALGLASAEDTPKVYSRIACELASALETAGDPDAAENSIRQAKATNKDPDVIPDLQLVEAALAEDRGDHDLAVSIYQQALAAGSKTPPIQWSAHAALASIYAAKNDPASDVQARTHFEAAVSTIEANRADQLTSDYQITFLTGLIRFYQEYVAFLMRKGDVPGALLVAESSRASILTHDVNGTGARGDRDLIRRIQAAARRSNAAYLFYLLAPGQSYLWVVTGSGIKSANLPGQREIENQIRSYRRSIEEARTDPLHASDDTASRLFQSLVEPAMTWIPRNAAVVVVPDGALHSLNFETLVVKAPTPHYWIEDVTVSIAPSLSILTAEAKPGNPAHRSLLLIGDPKPAGDFARLPGARDEMQEVSAHFDKGETRTLTGAQAVPASYTASHPTPYSVIHIAAHAQANEREPLKSAVILSPTSPAAEDFRLYAQDIMKVPLTARLVTLSACRSAGARTLSGEGAVGFAWAFLKAGADNVIASLWDVNDRSTAELMNSFYTAVDSGKSYAAALREAKLAMLQKGYRKPIDWAAFQLYSRRFQ